MTTQNEQDNETVLDGGRTNTGKNKQSFKRIIIGIVIFILFIGSCSMLKSCGSGRRETGRETSGEIVPQKDPQPPFTVTCRRAFFESDGMVIKMHNTSSSGSLKCWVQPKAVSGRLGPTVSFVIRPGEMKEVGWMELDRWRLEDGETVTITFEGNNRIMTVRILRKGIEYDWD